jgi:hypothetical protein
LHGRYHRPFSHGFKNWLLQFQANFIIAHTIFLMTSLAALEPHVILIFTNAHFEMPHLNHREIHLKKCAFIPCPICLDSGPFDASAIR